VLIAKAKQLSWAVHFNRFLKIDIKFTIEIISLHFYRHERLGVGALELSLSDLAIEVKSVS
jgi:hypothetical protein